jgi:anti-sigma factor RsiW
MDCAKIQEQLVAYLDGELDPQEKAGCESHLAGCPLCLKEKETLERTWQLLESAPSIEPSPAFRARFWERVRQEEQSWSGLAFPRLVPAMAGLLAVWVVGVGVGSLAFMRSSTLSQDFESPAAQWMPLADASSLGTAYLRRMEDK